MNQVIHYLALLFIVFVLAEIRNVLVYDTPYDSEPISIWEESHIQQPPEITPATYLR